jgi:hypothetical protein
MIAPSPLLQFPAKPVLRVAHANRVQVGHSWPAPRLALGFGAFKSGLENGALQSLSSGHEMYVAP